MLRLRITAACLLALAACGEEFNSGPLEVDPLHFSEQRFDCDDRDDTFPRCPPFTCQVDETGTVVGCSQACSIDNDSTAFEGPEGVELCVPPTCTVEAENTSPDCDPGCSHNGVTIYLFLYRCG